MTDQPGAGEIPGAILGRENNQTEPLAGLGANIHSMVDYYRNNISSKVNPDGSFINVDAEKEAVENWDSWYYKSSLPKKTEENKETWMQEMEAAIKGLTSDPTQAIHYADRPLLIEYYETKYPHEQERIQDIFASFDHDMNLISGGISATFSTDIEDRKENDNYRKEAMLKWPEDLLEAAAQEFEDKYPKENFDLAHEIKELKELFNLATSPEQYDINISVIDKDNKGTFINGSRILIKKSLYNLFRNVQKKATTGTEFRHYITLIPTSDRLTITINDNAGGFRGEDAKLIEVDENTPIYNQKGKKIIPKPSVFDLGSKGVNSKGTGRGMHTAWKTIVDMHHGTLVVSNILRDKDIPDPFGAKFTASIPYDQAA